MKRADVVNGVEYAVRRGSYGSFARIVIVADATREIVVHRSFDGTVTRMKTERGVEGKVIEGTYMPGNFQQALRDGKTGFVRPRDISHTWVTEVSRRKNVDRLKHERDVARHADEAERKSLADRCEAIGVNSGIKLGTDGSSVWRIEMNRQALDRLLEIAESDCT